ncbi:hypothetical protein RSAG8_03229, partial [Rhizoctonia solani AG-8 WAC10335]
MCSIQILSIYYTLMFVALAWWHPITLSQLSIDCQDRKQKENYDIQSRRTKLDKRNRRIKINIILPVSKRSGEFERRVSGVPLSPKRMSIAHDF